MLQTFEKTDFEQKALIIGLAEKEEPVMAIVFTVKDPAYCRKE
ncbi:MAG: hypothetical protein ACLFUS_10980 [Candidatus Sumerlaeia bacterium]